MEPHVMYQPGAAVAYAIAFGLLVVAAVLTVRLLGESVHYTTERLVERTKSSARTTPAPSPLPAPTYRGKHR